MRAADLAYRLTDLIAEKTGQKPMWSKEPLTLVQLATIRRLANSLMDDLADELVAAESTHA